MKYRAEIDGLRALAVIPVMFFHAGFELFSGGYIGVDIFFVISGYLITTILIEKLEDDKFSILDFYEKRARRILPALFLITLFCVPFALIWMVPYQIEGFSRSLIAVSLFVSNVLFWQESGYFEPSAEEKPLLHTWSLAVEEQYYIVFPVFLFLAWRFGKDRVFWTIAVLAALSLGLSEWGWRNAPSANFYLAPARAWELLAGSICAFVAQKHGVRGNNALASIGLVATIVAIFVYDRTTPFPSVFALAPILGTMLIILYGNEETHVAKILGHKALVGIGLISYSLYLWHQPLFAFARIYLPEAPTALVMLALTLVSFLLAYLSWRYVETPFRDRDLVPRKTVFLLVPVALFTPLAIGMSGHLHSGFYDQFYDEQQKKTLGTASISPKRMTCHTGGRDHITYNDACEYMKGDLKIAVFGDSHTVELAYALGYKLQNKNIKVKHLSFSNCVPSFQQEFEGFEDCSRWTNATVDAILKDERITHVVVSYRMAYALHGTHETTYPRFADERGPELRAEIWGAFVKTLEALVQADKKVIYVLQAPELPKHVNVLIARQEPPQITGVPQAWWEQRTSYITERLDQLPKGVQIVDPAKTLCKDGVCLASSNGIAFYFDNNHLSIFGALGVANEVLALMKADLSQPAPPPSPVTP